MASQFSRTAYLAGGGQKASGGVALAVDKLGRPSSRLGGGGALLPLNKSSSPSWICLYINPFSEWQGKGVQFRNTVVQGLRRWEGNGIKGVQQRHSADARDSVQTPDISLGGGRREGGAQVWAL